jgi:hypothetical protein
VTIDRSDPVEVPGLVPEVKAQIVRLLGGRAEKVFACVRTAAAFLAQAHGADGEGLRLVESACYNLREAFDAVVAGQEAVEGGLGEVVEAWRRYEFAIEVPGADGSAVSGELHAVLRRVAQDEDRQGSRVRQLLAFVRDQTGVEPLPGDGDPLMQYNRLRNQAAGTLHADGSVAAVSALYDDAVGWFGRLSLRLMTGFVPLSRWLKTRTTATASARPVTLWSTRTTSACSSSTCRIPHGSMVSSTQA